MKTTLPIVLLMIVCAGSGTVAQAVCVGASVNSFGASSDGVSDDTAAIRSAINAASSAGGGSVVFGVARCISPPLRSLSRRAWSCAE
jgi:polygalacturonase